MRTTLEFGFTVLLGSITYLLLLSVVRGAGINQFRPQPPCGLIAKSPKTLVSRLGKIDLLISFLHVTSNIRRGGHLKKGCLLDYYLLRKSVILYIKVY